MDAPTPTEIRSWSQVDFDDRGFPEPTDPDPDPLQRVIDVWLAWLEDKTGQDLDLIDLTGTPDRATVRLSLRIQEALRMLVEWATAQASEDISETAADISMIQSFSAGSYNETRRTSRMMYNFHPWRDLDDLLTGLLTDEKKAELGGDVPAVGVVEPDWDVGREIIDAKKKIIGPFGPLYDPYG